MVVTFYKNGPAVIQLFGDEKLEPITVIREDGSQEEKKTVAICRCGRSQNTPYCDGSHKSKTKQEEFVEKLKQIAEGQIYLDSEIGKFVNENYWKLLDKQ